MISGVMKAVSEDMKELGDMMKGSADTVEQKGKELEQRIKEANEAAEKEDKQQLGDMGEPARQKAHEYKEKSSVGQSLQEGTDSAARAAGQAVGRVEAVGDAARDRMHEARESASQRADETSRAAGENVEAAKEDVSSAGQRVADAAADTTGKVVGNVEGLADAAKDRLQQVKEAFQDSASKERESTHQSLSGDGKERAPEPATGEVEMPPVDMTSNTAEMVSNQ